MRLIEFFQEDNGTLSATRLAFLAWAFGVLAMWLYESWRCNHIQELNHDVLTILGILMTGKVVQKFREAPATDQPAPPGKPVAPVA